MSIVLIHDLVEIYAGDTFAYDEEAKLTQQKREADAADKLLACFLTEYPPVCAHFGTNSKHGKHPRPNSHIHLTISSP